MKLSLETSYPTCCVLQTLFPLIITCFDGIWLGPTVLAVLGGSKKLNRFRNRFKRLSFFSTWDLYAVPNMEKSRGYLWKILWILDVQPISYSKVSNFRKKSQNKIVIILYVITYRIRRIHSQNVTYLLLFLPVKPYRREKTSLLLSYKIIHKK